MERRDHNLLFLLSSMTLACAVGDVTVGPSPFSAGGFGDDEGEGTMPTDGDGSGDDTGAGDTVGQSMNDTGGAPTTADSGVDASGPAMDDASGPPIDTSGPPMDTLGDTTGYGYTTGYNDPDSGPVGPACAAYGANVANCNGGSAVTFTDNCYYYIDLYYAYYGPACASAAEELFACIGGLSCMELAAGQGCDQQSAALNAAC